MATEISSVFFTVLLFFAVVNMSQTATGKWDITEILSLSGITGEEICKSGDLYNVVLCGPTSICDCCTNWCNNKCSGMGSSVVNQKCTKFINSEGYPTTRCECCCKNMSPPPPSPPPPSPPPPSEICKPGDIHDVVLCGPTRECTCCNNWCEDKCRGMGSSVTTQKCTKFINSEGYPTTTCDCCCKNMSSPPPPSPSPPPPPPPPSSKPFCCPVEMEIQVSPDQAPCKYTLSPSIRSLPTSTNTSSLLFAIM